MTDEKDAAAAGYLLENVMTDKKMPPLPEPTYVHRSFDGDLCITTDLFSAEWVRTYARAYAAEQVRELVEALEIFMHATESGMVDSDLIAAANHARALIAKHKGTT